MRFPTVSFTGALTLLVVSGALSFAQRGAPRASTLLSVDDALTELTTLNSQKRFVAPFFGPMEYKNLQAGNVFGMVLSNGARVLGESSGRDYGLELSSQGAKQSAIGLLYVEGTLSIGGQPVPPGAYVVFASEQQLTLMTEQRAGSAPASGASVRLPLSSPLQSSQLDANSGDRARFAGVIEGGKAAVTIGANRLPVVPITARAASTEKAPPAVTVDRVSTPPGVTFTHRAPGEPERAEKDVVAPGDSKWLVASTTLRAVSASCDVAEIVLTGPDGTSVAAIGIATQPDGGFIKFESLPLGVGRGPSTWSVLRGSSNRVTLAVTGPEAVFHLLFAVPKAAQPTSIKLCSLGTAQVPSPKRASPRPR